MAFEASGLDVCHDKDAAGLEHVREILRGCLAGKPPWRSQADSVLLSDIDETSRLSYTRASL